MDKKNTVIGVLLLIAAFAFLFLGNRFSPPSPAAPEIAPTQAPMPTAPNRAPVATGAPAYSPGDTEFAALATSNADEIVSQLTNDFVTVSFTNFGGAIAEVAFRDYTSALEVETPFVFNHPRVEPISATNREVVYAATLEGRLRVTRRYSLGTASEGSDPYVIRHETTLTDLSGAGAPLTLAALSLGTTSLVSPNDYGQYLNVMAFDGEDVTYTKPDELEGGGFLAMVGVKDGAPKSAITKGGTVTWAAVNNQFFASVYTGDTTGISTTTRRVELPPFPGSTRPNKGLTGVVSYTVPALAGGGLGGARRRALCGPQGIRSVAHV